MRNHILSFVIPVVALLTPSIAAGDTITIELRDSSAVDGLIDGTSEVFETGFQSLGDAMFRFRTTITSDGASLVDLSDELGHAGGTDGNFDVVGENVDFSIELIDFTSGATGPANASLVSFSAGLLNFEAANGTTDSGTVSMINGLATSLTWLDMNGASDFTGHDPGNEGINLFVANSSQNVTSFRHEYAGGAWRIDNLTIEFSAIPEPSQFFALGGFCLLMGFRVWRKRNTSAATTSC